jgi:calcineurin-like phosphoesterase family protein
MARMPESAPEWESVEQMESVIHVGLDAWGLRPVNLDTIAHLIADAA